jgi:hypothetical protein
MEAAGRPGPVRFVLELIPTQPGRVEGVLVREGSDEPQGFSGWLDLLRLLERAAQGAEVCQPPLPDRDLEREDPGGTGGGVGASIELDEPRGPPRRRLLAEAARSAAVRRRGLLTTRATSPRRPVPQ